MPRNNDLNKILLIGSGPIVIGQGCEFDYSGVQACKALREERYEVVLVNSNPATIMTDPEFADRTYIEPITAEVIEAIIEREKPDAILPTLGGQTALNAAMELNRNGALARHGVKLIGANAQAIAKGEDRQLFKEAMLRIGLEVPRSGVARSLADVDRVADEIGAFPLIIRPAFTLGGTGGGIAYNREELDVIVARGLDVSPVREVLIEESLVGWKEFEMEVMRDRMDNCVVVCSIENFDGTNNHTVVHSVAHHLHLELLPAHERFFDQHLADRRDIESARDDHVELFAVIGDAAASAAKGKCWPNNEREGSDFICNAINVCQGARDPGARHLEPDAQHCFLE